MNFLAIHLKIAPETKEKLELHCNKEDLVALQNTVNKLERQVDVETRRKLSPWYPLSNTTRFFNYFLELCDMFKNEVCEKYILRISDNFQNSLESYNKSLQNKKKLEKI